MVFQMFSKVNGKENVKSFFQKAHSISQTFFLGLAFSRNSPATRYIHKPETNRDMLVTFNLAIFLVVHFTGKNPPLLSLQFFKCNCL